MEKRRKKIIQFHWKLVLLDLWRHVWLIVVAGLIGAMCVFIFNGLIHTPEYTSTVTMAVSPRANSSYVGFYTSLDTASEMAEVFKETFSSAVLKRLVQEDLDDPTLPVNVTAEVETGTNILRISTTASTPLAAHEVMESVLRNYGRVSEYLFGNVVLDTIRSPHIPTEASNQINMPFWCGVCAAAGMIIMTLLLVVLSLSRNTVKVLEGANHYMGEAPLGVLVREKSIRYYKRRKQRGLLIWRSAVSFRYTEALLQVAHKVRHRMAKGNHKILLITSVAENEGKSTVAANIAYAIARHGHRVALLDLDLRRPAVHKLFSEKGDCIDLQHAINEGYTPTEGKRLHVFTSTSTSNPGILLHGQKFAEFLDQLRSQMDYIIMDSAPYTAVADTGMLLKHADACVMTIRQDWVPCKVLRDVANELDEGHAEYIGYVLNNYLDNGDLKQSTKSHYSYG